MPTWVAIPQHYTNNSSSFMGHRQAVAQELKRTQRCGLRATTSVAEQTLQRASATAGPCVECRVGDSPGRAGMHALTLRWSAASGLLACQLVHQSAPYSAAALGWPAWYGTSSQPKRVFGWLRAYPYREGEGGLQRLRHGHKGAQACSKACSKACAQHSQVRTCGDHDGYFLGGSLPVQHILQPASMAN